MRVWVFTFKRIKCMKQVTTPKLKNKLIIKLSNNRKIVINKQITPSIERNLESLENYLMI